MTVTAMPKNETPEGAPAKRRPVRLLAFIVVLLIAAAAGWFLVLHPMSDKGSGAPKPPVKGAIEKLSSMQLNLAGGHYLRLGVALQLTKKAGESVDTANALDAEIDTFSNLSLDQVATKAARDQLKAAYLKELASRYDDKIVDVYYTEFVTQ